MTLHLAPYLAQQAQWPPTGRHILAQYDAETVVVYQAYRLELGHWSAKHGYFGGAWSLSRMSWIKPNFLWMMYRCGWGRKEGQEVTLAIHLRRAAFDTILAQAVPSSFDSALYADEAAWKVAVVRSDVRLQWDPDHTPKGAPLPRGAIQLGLRGPVLARFAREWIVQIEDISDFVREQAMVVQAGALDRLLTPAEAVYPVADPAMAARLGLAPPEPS